MRKFVKSTFYVLISSLLFFSGCEQIDSIKKLEIPETVSVKSSGAKYEIPLGEGSIILQDKLSIADFREKISENINDPSAPEIKVYDYNPDGHSDVQQYLLKYPIKNIPIALSNDTAKIDELELTSKFPFPELKDKISNLGFAPQDLNVPEPGSLGKINTDNLPSLSEPLGIQFNITSPDFKTLTFAEGKFDILVGSPSQAVPGDFILKVKVILYSQKNGTKLAESTEMEIQDGNKHLELNLAGSDGNGITVTPRMFLKIEGTAEGGTLGQSITYPVSMTSNSLKIKKITGLTMTPEDIGDLETGCEKGQKSFEQEFEFKGLNDSLESASIEEGHIEFNITIPDGWKNITCETSDITITQTGGTLNITDDKVTDLSLEGKNYLFNKKAVLDDSTITSGQVKLAGKVKLSLNDATIVYNEGDTQPKLDFYAKCKVEKMKEIKIKIDSLGIFDKEIETGLDFFSMVKDALKNGSDELLENIEFEGIEGYVFAVQPDLEAFKNVNFNASVEAKYTKRDGGPGFRDLIHEQPLALKKANFDFDVLAKGENYTITDSSPLSDAEPLYSLKVNSAEVCGMINDLPSDLKIHYNFSSSVGAGDVLTITGDEFEKLKNIDNSAIDVFLIIQLPLQLKLSANKDYDLISSNPNVYGPKPASHAGGTEPYFFIYDVFSITDQVIEDDLLKRDSADDEPAWKDYSDIIKSVKVVYKNVNSTGLDMVASMIDGASGINKSIPVKTGQHELELNKEDLNKLFDNYPFTPRLELKVYADGTLKKVPRNAEFKISAYVQIETSGEVKIWGDDKEDD